MILRMVSLVVSFTPFFLWMISNSCADPTRQVPRTNTEFIDAISRYYSQWEGVPAPRFREEIRPAVGDSTNLSIDDYRGSFLLLYSFDSGDFVRSVEVDEIVDRFKLINEQIVQQEKDVSVIGFTYGTMFFDFVGIELPESLEKVVNFPVVNMTKIEMQEPYDLLRRLPAAILVDGKGVIVQVFVGHLTIADCEEILNSSSWQGPTQTPPQPPPSYVKEYSWRKPFGYYVYARDLQPGEELKKGGYSRDKVFSALLLPEDRVERIREVLGRTVDTSVDAGEPVLRRHFSFVADDDEGKKNAN